MKNLVLGKKSWKQKRQNIFAEKNLEKKCFGIFS